MKTRLSKIDFHIRAPARPRAPSRATIAALMFSGRYGAEHTRTTLCRIDPSIQGDKHESH